MTAHERTDLPPRAALAATTAVAATDVAGGRALRSFWAPGGVRPYLVVSDVAVFWLSLLVAPGPLWPGLFTLLVGTVAVLAAVGAYRSRLSLSILDDVPAIAGAVVMGTGLEFTVRTVVGEGISDRGLLRRAAVVAVLLVAERALFYFVVRHVRRLGHVSHRTLILGAGQVGGQLADAIVRHPSYGLRPVGFLDPDPLIAPRDLAVPVLGDYTDLAATVRRHRVTEVIVAFGSTRESSLVDVLRTCDRLDCEIFFVPRLFELQHRCAGMDEIWGIPLVRLRRATWRSPAWRVKRCLDVAAAFVCLLVVAPLLIVIAALVRLEGGKGVIYKQTRVGLDGRPFTLLKFRSLRPGDDAESATLWSVGEDARVGRVGRWLRRTSLDELPQLVNVLRGEMSLVGPRPERPHFVAEFAQQVPRYTSRHRAPAGLTGWAQVNGLRGNTSIEDRARFDNYYIENWSLWLDLKIVARTVTAVLLRRGS